MPKIKQSIECWLFKRNGADTQVVLLRVAEREGNHPSFLQPVTGGIEPGETPEQACLREVREETGLSLAVDGLRRVPDAFTVVIDENLTINKTLFFAEIRNVEINVNPDEHVGWDYCAPTEVLLKLHWQSNKDTWKLVQDCLERKS